MKNLGIFLIVAGIAWALFAFNMDTTVTTESHSYGSIYLPSQSVNNLGLMETRRNNIMFAGLTILVGVVLVGFGSLSQKSLAIDVGLKACPFCAEPIQPIAQKCRYCSSDLPDSFREPLVVPVSAVANDRLKEQLAIIQRGSASFETYENVVVALGGSIRPVGLFFDMHYLIELDSLKSRVDKFEDLQQWFLENIESRIST